jgi:hypothetical protein
MGGGKRDKERGRETQIKGGKEGEGDREWGMGRGR